MWHLSDTATFEPNCKRVFSGASRTSCTRPHRTGFTVLILTQCVKSVTYPFSHSVNSASVVMFRVQLMDIPSQ